MVDKKKNYWICQIGGWSFYMLINTIFLTMAGKMNLYEFIMLLPVTAFFIFSTHMYRKLIIRWGWLRLLLPRLIPRVLLACLILGALSFGFQLFEFAVFGQFENIIGWNVDAIFAILGSTLPNATLYFLWSLIYFMYHYVQNYNQTLKYEAVINEMELNKLKSQLNPHFIFNALNSIRALVDEDPRKSKLAITQLSNILRSSLITDKKRLIPFDVEMKTVVDYLELESVRFEERLKITFDLDPHSGDFDVPPLMIQTLVENGIKHGISSLINGGEINVASRIIEEKLLIQIRNSGQYKNGYSRPHSGYGLDNTKQRLRLIFGTDASFSIQNEDDKTVLTEVLVPKRER
ncbi:sensor histidine kinase [Roseivirga sp. BDSF3-8]|uniref:sensor histidine kinase n=1 Tax=Roseivirga sp. BDSF3-8 TaxID=3241598 RepID=UPI0035320A4B